MLWQLATLLVLRAQDVLAQGSKLGASDFIRFGCSQLVVERTDPLVTPGMNPSPHMQYVSPHESHGWNLSVGGTVPREECACSAGFTNGLSWGI